MEIRKLSSPPKQEEVRTMVLYAKNVIEEFRRAKHYKNILYLSVYTCIISLPFLLSVCLSSLRTTITSQPPLVPPQSLCCYSLILWHPPVSCWRYVSWAWRRWELYLQTPMCTCCTWCIRPWVSVSTCKTGMELWATERRSFSHTGELIRVGSAEVSTNHWPCSQSVVAALIVRPEISA